MNSIPYRVIKWKIITHANGAEYDEEFTDKEIIEGIEEVYDTLWVGEKIDGYVVYELVGNLWVETTKEDVYSKVEYVYKEALSVN